MSGTRLTTPLAPWLRVAVAMTAVGWGANQFAALLVVYRRELPESFVATAVGVYALGLIPALLVSAAIADRVNRRDPVRFAVLLSACGSVLLVLGAAYEPLLHTGRLVAGVATGAALAPGTAWVMDLSRSAGTGAGARRATVALSLGFGGGPLVAGLIAQWSPAPEVTPYVVHLALSVPVALLVWNAPVTPVVHDPSGPSRAAEVRAVLRSKAFLAVVPVTAPWSFGVATTAFAIAPSMIAMPHLPIATAAVVTGLTLGTGVAIQPWGKRMERRARGRTLWVGMLFATVGLVVCALAFAAPQRTWTLLAIAVLLGAGYGLLMVGGLSRVEVLTHPDDRATVNAVFYALTYLGFAAPYAVVLATAVFTATQVMLVGAVLAALSMLVVLAWRSAGEPHGGDPERERRRAA